MAAAAVLLVGLVGGGLLAIRRRRFVGATLMASWWWSVASWLAIVAGQWWTLAGMAPSPPISSAVLWIAAVGALCPLMSVLGAKRPQDKPWQFIVLSMWVVLSLPASQTLLIRPDRPPSIPGALSLFVLAIVAAGVWNSLGTRYLAAALAAACGQLLLLAPHIGWVSESPLPGLAGMVLLAIGWAVSVAVDRLPTPGATPLDQAWIEFRDAYGGFWAARVLDRMNSAGQTQHWSVRLQWSGFEPVAPDAAAASPTAAAGGDSSPSAGTTSDEAAAARSRQQLVKTLVNLLRRFQSPQWIAARLGADLE